MSKENKVYLLSDEEFISIVNGSTSYLQVVKAVGYGSKYGRYAYDLIKKRCEELNLSTDHFCRQTSSFKRYELSDVLIENSPYINTNHLKNRLIKEGLLEYKCSICGNTGEWNGQPLSLQIDHINGNHTDNRLENLRLLCPNCHSQTETYGIKNRN